LQSDLRGLGGDFEAARAFRFFYAPRNLIFWLGCSSDRAKKWFRR
jgi:hypothetical protein